jgi:hypothetical protein
VHELGEQLVKVVGAYLAPLRIPAAIVKAGPNTALNGLDHLFIFHLDTM